MSSREKWDDAAATFDDEADHGLRDPVVRRAWESLLTPLLPPAPARVADLGCGTGTLSLLLAESGHRVDGVDFAPAMVSRAITKAGTTAGVRFLVGDAADPPLEDGGYDVVLCRHVLWALPEPAAALARWCELLAPEGRLVLVEGSWSTGAGLTAADTSTLLEQVGRTPQVTRLPEEVYWGKEIEDERYVVVG